MRIGVKRPAMIGLLVLLSAAGCGGGGGGTPPFPIATVLRSLQVGDSWTYDVTGTQRSPGGATVNVSGTVTASIVQEVIGGQTVLGASTSGTLTASSGGGVTLNTITYGTQDAGTHNLFEFGEREGANPVRIVTDNPLPVATPGTWGVGTALSNTAHFNDGSTETSTLTVQGQEVVGTAVGSFTAWKTSETVSSSLTGSSNGTSWWAPQMGQPVKETFSKTFADGTVLTLTFTLRSSTVPSH